MSTPASSARRKRGRPRRRRREEGGEERSVWTLVSRAAALVGLAGATAGLLFTFLPDLRPVGRAPTTKAAIANLQVEPGLTFRQYLQRVDQEPGGLDETKLAERGAFLEFDVETTGLRERPLALKLELVDAGTGDEVGQEQSTTVTPQANEDALAWHAFLPFPARARGPFVARVELLDGQGEPLARKRSEPFPAARPA